MAEKGILMSTPMVEGTLDDRKTETRRLVKGISEEVTDHQFGYTAFTPPGHISMRGYFTVDGERRFGEKFIKSPYGVVGDILYVRETWEEYHGGINYKAGRYGLLGDCWKPSLFLKKKDSRIWLKITSLGIERLHKITEEGAIAEGIIDARPFGFRYDLICQYETGVEAYKGLWNQINGKDSWEINPFVWVIKYKVLSKTGRPSDL